MGKGGSCISMRWHGTWKYFCWVFWIRQGAAQTNIKCCIKINPQEVHKVNSAMQLNIPIVATSVRKLLRCNEIFSVHWESSFLTKVWSLLDITITCLWKGSCTTPKRSISHVSLCNLQLLTPVLKIFICTFDYLVLSQPLIIRVPI